MFLLGHSMGGAVALAYALEHQDKLAGLVLSAAATSWPGGTATPFVPRAAVALVSAVVPRASTNRIDKANLTRDPAEHQAYLDDPLIAQRAQPARTLSELLNAFVRFRAETPRLTLPLLVLHGTADRITAPEGSRWLVEHAGSTDKELVLYDGFVHELLNEPPDDRERVTDDIVAWLRARTPAESARGPAQHLHDEERQLERLLGVQPRVARRLVARAQLAVGDRSRRRRGTR